MTSRTLRIATTLIIIHSLLFFPAPVSRAQDHPSDAEIKQAQEVAELFLKRLEETGDFSRIIDEMYAEDFIERYLQQQIRESEGLNLNSCSDIEFLPGLVYKRKLLKQATVEDWKRLYIAASNFTYHFDIAVLNKHADDFLNGRELDDKRFEKCIPSKVIELFNNHPILNGRLGIDDDEEDDKSGVGDPDGQSQSDAAREESEPKSIETPEEMQSVTETLEECLRLLLEEHGNHSPRLTEPAKSALEVIRLKLKEKGRMEPRITVSDKKYLGFPPGTRILIVPTPNMFYLEIAEVNGKQKIVWAQFFGSSC
jgi:hypothetical protein